MTTSQPVRKRMRLLAGAVGIIALAALASLELPSLAVTGVSVAVSAEPLPHRLSNAAFWKLISELSEPDGEFHSDNLVSNEGRFQHVMPALTRTVKPGRAYLGVGPEQNFSYIAATRPEVAFIVDLRRGNLLLHLMYKALFELSSDRADFVARLFSRPRPDGLTTASTAIEIFDAYDQVPASDALYKRNLKDVMRHLTDAHGFVLTKGDREGLELVYSSMFLDGPGISYRLYGRGSSGGFPDYADLMTATDGEGRSWSYLGSEEAFRYVKDLQGRNMIVPIVGNFAGPKALRAVGAYLRQSQTTVSAFYTSNVEQYLRQDRLWNAFCANAVTLPLDDTSTFIRTGRSGLMVQAPIVATSAASPVTGDLASCQAAAR